MKMEVGKWYDTREGGVGKIVGNDGDPAHGFCDENGISYTDTGAYLFGQKHRLDLISEHIEPKSEPVAEYGPWIGWNGGECPVGLADAVEISTNAGLWVGPASDISWTHGGNCPVYAYRVKVEPEVHTLLCHYDPRYGGRIFSGSGPLEDDRDITITVQCDNIKAEWVDE